MFYNYYLEPNLVAANPEGVAETKVRVFCEELRGEGPGWGLYTGRFSVVS
jgi:hypothetical protein